jgi:hypothetical protein
MTGVFAFAATVALGLVASAWAEQPASTLTCVKVAGMIGDPMVPTPEVAREIYQTIARAQGDEILQTHEILVEDDGQHWSVYQFPIIYDGRKGGGTLKMKISKCDAGIRAHYSR